MRTRCLALCALSLFLALSLRARNLPTIDELSSGRARTDAASLVAQKARERNIHASGVSVEPRFAVPTFVWLPKHAPEVPNAGRPNDGPARHGRPEEAAARAYLGHYAALYNLERNDVDNAVVRMIHNTGRGPIVVKLQQQIDGVEIFREEINVVMNRNSELVGIAGYITSRSVPGAKGRLTFDLDGPAAVSAAVGDLTGTSPAKNQLVASASRGGYDLYEFPGGASDDPVRLKKVYFHLPEGLEPGYYVEVSAPDIATNTIDHYAYVISANDGRILFRHNLTADATPYTYRVWGSATGVPQDSPAGNAPHPKVNPTPNGYQAPFVGQTDVTLPNFTFSSNDAWLPFGSTETVGNNVDAYADMFYPDGYTPSSGDYRASTTATNAFLRTYDFAQPTAAAQRQAAITQLFVNINYLHDWFYDSGFDEAAGNAQQDNFGRGGIGGDSMRAESADYSGSNNANMYTPADGSRPRMQMYMFSGLTSGPTFTVLSPAAAAGGRTVGTAIFGPQTFDVTADVVGPQPASACSALTNAAAVAGKIVMVDREPTSGADSCSVATKLTNIAAAGAAGIVVVNLSSWPDTTYPFGESMPGFTTPTLSITYNGSVSIRSQLAAGAAVSGRMFRSSTAVARDGTLDNGIVFHEWAHYLTNRLVGNASGLTTNQAWSLGEGWADFLAMLLMVRPDDTATPSNATWNGIYPMGSFVMSGGPDGGTNQGYYFGIRRAPYSTDFTKNALTFKHIQSGVSLPSGMLLNPNTYFNNAQVHNSGEIWTLMLWECYAALLRDTQGATPRLTFAEAQQRMKDYLVASLKVTPVNPTFIEARDAVLAVAAASDMQDYVKFYQAFAKRGAGMGAVAPDRYSYNHIPVTESYSSGGGTSLTAVTLTDNGGSCDNDGVLDRGESGELTITLKNIGTVDLDGMTGTVSSLTAGITLPSGGAVTFPDVAPLATSSVTVPVAMSAGTTGIQYAQFSLQLTHASLDTNPSNLTLGATGNIDVLTAVTATDTVDTASTPWAKTFGTASSVAPWTRHAALGGPQTYWHGQDAGTVSDERLESPPMTIGAGGSFKIEFDHSWSFEPYYDGGVVEMSKNGGAWTDIGGSAYNGFLHSSSGNPIGGRNAFVWSGGPTHVTLKPAVSPGDVVKVRFRIGTDAVVGGTGWNIDTITFSGIVETPFHQLSADSGCTKATTTLLTSSANPVKAGNNVTFTARAIAPGTPTGTMTFYDGANDLGTVAMLNGVATLASSSLSVGTHSMTAQYSGAASYLGSTSPILSQLIDDCTAAPAFNSVTVPSSCPAGGTVTLSASATGGLSPQFQWYIGVSGDTSTLAGTGASINVTPTQQTSYWVRVSNACGHASSAAFIVTPIQPAKFHTVRPCRLYDSRTSGEGMLQSNQTRTKESQGYPGACGFNTYVPYDVRALSVNVTVVDATDKGTVVVYRSGIATPSTSIINYRAGQNRANNAIVPVTQPWGGYTVYNSGPSPVHYIIDLNGYFY